jgi:hypothetical protein
MRRFFRAFRPFLGPLNVHFSAIFIVLDPKADEKGGAAQVIFCSAQFIRFCLFFNHSGSDFPFGAVPLKKPARNFRKAALRRTKTGRLEN